MYNLFMSHIYKRDYIYFNFKISQELMNASQAKQKDTLSTIIKIFKLENVYLLSSSLV